jgi:transcriptional regulator with XRE-family HTH domain
MIMQKLTGEELALDEFAKLRLSQAIKELRGDRSQRVFGEIIGIGQSTIHQWESGAGGTPTLDNLEKIAKLREELPEQFVAYLYGRTIETGQSLDDQIQGMTCAEIADLLSMATRRLRRGEH